MSNITEYPNRVTSACVALTVAGSDSGAGAGIQADLKTFAALGVYGASAITALTAQNTQGVQAVESVSADFVLRQVQSVLADMPVKVIKTGMLANAEIISALASELPTFIPLVLDPVMVATSGDRLLADDALQALRQKLIPRACLLTPNLHEAAALLDAPVAESVAQMTRQAEALLTQGAQAVLLKGGHLQHPDEAVDVYLDAERCELLRARRVRTANTHGTGCTLASAIAAFLARGLSSYEACREAKHYLTGALTAADRLQVGRGHGPVDHFYAFSYATVASAAPITQEISHDSE
ncbi:bifunctional hydroxymethylpyrimidine kinase/phosphomethylpyrimidine kinase [Gilvimarinus sp. DA14]|uniref:bifunctional hydroxymethylpyrimidine kinase/phosphomethylpyrimidine kinase n=1 Tax=Gilvimarinus sp. DA14 TaxID=2956798 RepID=UPI0020B8B27C|nr:bifunctional hydroxymethylpyrimidine kinase/phosphomethylpyrimidine kinase [Gilvimarinus sp. DA14]UTF61784.1 bifunctional hydroxymethylpyrimidine kinase/phosphomethylpyrimidine kinase [Gilvimarinus sp. DA14]